MARKAQRGDGTTTQRGGEKKREEGSKEGSSPNPNQTEEDKLVGTP
jgi:hypothetical protein